MGTRSEDAFIKQLYKDHKDDEKQARKADVKDTLKNVMNNEMGEIYRYFLKEWQEILDFEEENTTVNTFKRYILREETTEKMKEALKKMKETAVHCNKSMQRIKKYYKCVVPVF